MRASNEVLQAVQQRAAAERAFANALSPPALRADGFAQGGSEQEQDSDRELTSDAPQTKELV